MKKRDALVGAVLAGFACGAAVVQGVHAQAKPPAYTIAEIEVTDPPMFQKYGDATRTSIPAAGGRVIVRGGICRHRSAAKANCRHPVGELGKGSGFFRV